MRINLATSTDDKYARYAYVMIVSALENKNDEDEIFFYLLHAGLKERYLSDFKAIEDRYPGFIFARLKWNPQGLMKSFLLRRDGLLPCITG